jgi:hypothetical protein
MFSKESLESFDEKNGLLGIDRDCFLSIVRYISPKNLRRYIGLSEETFQRINHFFYNVYRLKYNKIPAGRLFIKKRANDIRFNKRKLIGGFGYGCGTITLKEPIFENIFEMKIEYTFGNSIELKQVSAASSKPYNDTIAGIILSIVNYTSTKMRFRKYYTILDICLDVTHCNKRGGNTLTFILDMREGKNTLYFKMNDILIPYAFNKISHTHKNIEIFMRTNEIIHVIHTKDLTHLPIEEGAKIEYYSFQ